MSRQEHPDVFSKASLQRFVKPNECNATALEKLFQREGMGAAKQRVRQRKIYQNMENVCCQ